ncbi:hypothetical protein QUG75_21575, partial [Enterobacter hormaechei]|uniref:hypothetical protein n=1 Tax=Enterobacter hormaechei TaxID=158836 RepID=UPI0025A1BA9F
VSMLNYPTGLARYFEHMPNAVGADAQNQRLVCRERSRSHSHFSSPDILYFLNKKRLTIWLYLVSDILLEMSEQWPILKFDRRRRRRSI